MAATTTFTPPVNPSIRSGKKVTRAKIRKANFGDGYEQRSADGLNSLRRNVVLRFDGLTEAQADTIETFLEARAGHDPFNYTLPDEASSRQWICESWQRTYLGNTLYSMDVPIREVFDL